jgi:hypothetical protein
VELAVRLSDRRIAWADLDVPLRLRSAAGPLDVTARRLAYVGDGSTVRECRLELTLEPEAFALVDAGELLHLDVAARGPGADGFAPTAEVRLEARLADDVLALALAESTDPRRAGERLGELSAAGDDSPLLSTESWFALTVTSQVELPPELAEAGSLRMGYSTSWATDEPDPPPR